MRREILSPFTLKPSSAQKTKCTSPVTTSRALPFFPGNIPDGWILERIIYPWIVKLLFQMVVVMGCGCVLCCICCSNLMIYCQLSVALNLMFTAACSLWETGGTPKKTSIVYLRILAFRKFRSAVQIYIPSLLKLIFIVTQISYFYTVSCICIKHYCET